MTHEPIRHPSLPTLAKYGLTLEEWLAYIPVEDGEYVCAICRKPPRTGRFVVDHEHARGWKQLPPAVRKRYVRGVVCTTCNHYVLTRYGSPAKHRAAAAYLEAYDDRQRS